MKNEIDEIQNINQEKEVSEEEEEEEEEEEKEKEEVSIIDIGDLWGDHKFEELANLVINKKKRDQLRKKYPYGPANKTKEDYLMESLVNEIIKDYEREEKDKKISTREDEITKKVTIKFKGLEGFKDSEVKLEELLSSLTLSHIKIEKSNREIYLKKVRQMDSYFGFHMPNHHETFKHQIKKYKDERGCSDENLEKKDIITGKWPISTALRSTHGAFQGGSKTKKCNYFNKYKRCIC
jgi:hypothetical protein